MNESIGKEKVEHDFVCNFCGWYGLAEDCSPDYFLPSRQNRFDCPNCDHVLIHI
jgi:rubrerythrin